MIPHNVPRLISQATPALERAMQRAGVDPAQVVLVRAASNGAYRVYWGIGVFGTSEAVVTRALDWLRSWLDSRGIERTRDDEAHVPDRFGDVSVSAWDDPPPTHLWRGLSAVNSYSLGD